MQFDFIEKHLEGGPFEVVLTLLALLGGLLGAIVLGRRIGFRIGQACDDIFGPRQFSSGRGYPELGRGLGALTSVVFYIGTVIGAVT